MTTETTTYSVEMISCDGGGSETIEIEATSLADAALRAEEETADWMRGGDWGDEGASVDGSWYLYGADGDEVDSGRVTVEIEPNHARLIADATRGADICGTDTDDHDWTSDGEGGLDENPGVWSTGGTALTIYTHCRRCGLMCVDHLTGSQCNPGEHDTVSYEMADDDQIARWRESGAMDEEA